MMTNFELICLKGNQKQSAILYENANYWRNRINDARNQEFETFFKENAIEYQLAAAKVSAESRRLLGIA